MFFIHKLYFIKSKIRMNLTIMKDFIFALKVNTNIGLI